MKHVLALILLAAACGATTKPSTDPLPSWGVPITGGTMIVTADAERAVVADPDRDRVTITELATDATTELPLAEGDEPGRLVEDAAGRIHIALRRGAAIATIVDGVITRRPVCAEPRGIAYDGATDTVVVACTTGELVTLPAAGGQATRSVFVDRDLRDVLVVNGVTYVSRFKTAELLQLDTAGAIVARVQIPDVERTDLGNVELPDGGGTVAAKAEVAWRAIVDNGKIVIVHQRALARMLSVHQGGYGGLGCGGTPIESVITIVTPGASGSAPTVATYNPIEGALPVDIAASHGMLAVASAGAGRVTTVLENALIPDDPSGCPQTFGSSDELGAPTAVAYAGDDLVAFYPELPGLVVAHANTKRTITLPGELGYDAGRNLFHRETNAGLACASCHPEGRDDGQVWTFEELGPRRTQVLAGDLLKRAPYHWTGDQRDLPTLMDDVFAVRMGGDQPTTSEHRALGPFLQRVAAPAPIVIAADAVARGKAVFEDASVGCTACHGGVLMTTKQIVDVGTGGAFKVPSLVGVGARAPFIHDGCAATLADRFSPTCGGGDAHGKTSQLTAAQVGDLVAYLESL